MSKLTRFGVSLDEELLERFDELCASRSYSNRSEAIRDLIRGALSQAGWGQTGFGSGVLTLVYDHHKFDLARRMAGIQHEDHDIIIATMHFHIDHDNCLEILAIKGAVSRVRDLVQKLISCKGVKYGVFNPAPEGRDLV